MTDVIEQFYKYACTNSVDVASQVDTFLLDDHMGFTCLRCDDVHILTRAYWKTVHHTVLHNTYVDSTGKGQFFNLTAHVNLRQYCAKYVTDRPQWEESQAWLAEQQTIIENFWAVACTSPLTEPTPEYPSLRSVRCPAHHTRHLVTISVFRDLTRALAFTPELNNLKATAPNLVFKTIRRVIERTNMELQDQIAVLKISEVFPPTPKVKASKPVKRTAQVDVAPSQTTKTKAPLPIASTSVKPQSKRHPLSAPTELIENSAFILPPFLVNDDLMVEYYVCGRKTSFLTSEAAKKVLAVQGSPAGYHVYACPHCTGYHYGHKPNKKATKTLYAKNGRRWYQRDAGKANRFIHNLMFR